MSSLQKPPAQLLVSAPMLKQLASQQMALNLCHYTAHHEIDVYDKKYEWDKFTANFPSNLDIVEGIPVLTEMVIKSLWGPVAYSVYRWYIYHQYQVFFDCETVYVNKVLVKCTDSFVLKANGTVNYLKSAQNLLLRDVLNDVEKFRFACINCMADDVRNIWPVVSDDPRVVNTDPQKHPMIYYWSCVMQDDVRRLPGGDDGDYLESCANIMKYMEWTVVEYFWNFLSNDEQVNLARMLFKKCKYDHVTTPEQLLFQLTPEQLKLMKMKQNDAIVNLMIYFFEEEQDLFGSSYFHEIWNYLANFTGPSEFSIMLASLVKDSFRDSWTDEYDLDSCQFLNQIWIRTPVHVKREFLSSKANIDNLFDALDTKELGQIFRWNYDMSFFITVLSELDFQTRETLWHQYWCSLIVGTKVGFLQPIMKLCFNNDDEITLFKERDMMHFPNIRNFCCLTIASNYVKELNEYLDFCSTENNTIKRQILASTDVQKAFLERAYDSFVEFDKFIDGAFFNEEDAREYKKKLMLSSKRLQDIYEKIDRSKIGVSWI